MNKFEVIENEVNFYKNTSLEQNPTFAPKMGDVYQLIDLFSVSRFRDGDRDSLGYKKVFFNVVNFLVDVCAKMLDLDTKDIYIKAEEGADYWTAWIMGKELKMWMKDKYFARQLNEYCQKWSKYGDLWVKKVKDDVKWVPPQNMIYRVNATDYRTIPLIERHEYGNDELRIVGKNAGWNNVEEVIKGSSSDAQTQSYGTTIGVKEDNVNSGIVIYEAWFPKGYLDEKSNWFIISKDSNLILAEGEKDCPYKKLSFKEVPFEDQIYLNRIANYKSTGFHWTSKHIYQTRSTNIEKNLMTQVDDGEILITNSEITPVVNEERNLNAYGADEQRWTQNLLNRTFTTEPISGQRSPAGTPLGSTVIQTQQATAFYKQKREELAEFIKEILWDWVLPQFTNQKRKEHKILIQSLLEGNDGESDKFFNLILNERMNKLRANSKYLSEDQWAIRKSIQAELLKKENMVLPKGFYDNLKYKIDIMITGEQLDVQARQATYMTIWQILGSNPTIFQDKRALRVFSKMLDSIGISPKDIFDEEVPTMQGTIGAQRGGSIAAPTPVATPTMQPVAQTL
ncbi:MAG: hypothetical protein WC933_02680 [Candidatus Paceibacterota bacterium]|jgi:hypothetical protein